MDMYFSRAQKVGGMFERQAEPLTQTVFSKVLFIDKRNNETKPQLYTLSPELIIETEDLQSLKTHFLSGFHDESFIPMGDLVSIDRKHKQAKSTNDTLISYEHLIVVTNAKHLHHDDTNDEELFSGLATLVDALRIKKHNIAPRSVEENLSRKSPPAFDKKRFHQSQSQDECTQLFPTPKEESHSDWVYDTDISLVEVQL